MQLIYINEMVLNTGPERPSRTVTVLVGAAMDGFKLKPVVVGKSVEPRPLAGNWFILH